MNRTSNIHDLHEEALERLCFVCGELMKGVNYKVEDYIALLGRALRCPDIFTIPGVTPHNFCKKCSSALRLVDLGKTIETTRTLLEWTECTANCSSCAIVSKGKVGGRRKKVNNLIYRFI